MSNFRWDNNKSRSATSDLYGRYSYQVGIRFGQRLGQLQVQHTAGHGPHPPQGASSLFVASTRWTTLGHTSCLDPLQLWNFSVLTRVGRGWAAQRRPATRWIYLLAVPGSGLVLVLVDPRVEDSPVNHLWLLGVAGGWLRQQLTPCPGEDLGGSSSNHNAKLWGLQQATLGIGRGIFAGFVVVKMVRRIRGFTSWGRSMKEACKLLWDVALPAVLQQSVGCGGRAEGRRRRSRVSLVWPVVCKDRHTKTLLRRIKSYRFA